MKLLDIYRGLFESTYDTVADGIKLDNKNGIGAMGATMHPEIYNGFTVEMTVDDYIKLTPNKSHQDEKLHAMHNAMKKDGVASPTLWVLYNDEFGLWEVTGHEGRHRSYTLKKFYGGDLKIPVVIIPNVEQRRMNISDDMKNGDVIAQDSSLHITGKVYDHNKVKLQPI